MNIKIPFFFILFLQIVWITNSSFAAQQSDPENDLPTTINKNNRLANTLEKILGVLLEIEGDMVVFKGERSQNTVAINKLNNFEELRKTILPISNKDVLVQVCPSSDFTNCDDFITSLGFKVEELDNIKLTDDPSNGSATLKYNSVLNVDIAERFITHLKTHSSFFNWASVYYGDQLIEKSKDFLHLHYKFLRDFLCTLEINEDSAISLKTVLSRLIAAGGGEISLQESSKIKQYHVRYITLGDLRPQSKKYSSFTIEFIIDNSASMASYNFDKLNEILPRFLKRIPLSLAPKESIEVRISTFGGEINNHATYILSQERKLDKAWKPIKLDRMSDLTQIGNRLSLSHNTKYKVIIALSDVDDALLDEYKLKEGLKKLHELSPTNGLSRAYLYALDTPSNPKAIKYLSEISKLSSIPIKDCKDMDTFGKEILTDYNIAAFLELTIPHVLGIGKENTIVWQSASKPGIWISDKTVQNGDTVTSLGISHTVNRDQNN